MSRPRFEWKYVTTGRMIDNKTSKIFDTKDECLCLLNDLEAQLAEARKHIGESINYRVFNLNADEAVRALRRAEQLKEYEK